MWSCSRGPLALHPPSGWRKTVGLRPLSANLTKRWRRIGDSNPEGVNPTRFPSERHRPLGESSVEEITCLALGSCTAYSVGRPLVWRHPVNSPGPEGSKGKRALMGTRGVPSFLASSVCVVRIRTTGFPTPADICSGRDFQGSRRKASIPEHGLGVTEWASLPPSQVRLAELITTKRAIDLEALLAEDSTFFGDLFAHVVKYQGDLYGGRTAPGR